MISRASLSAFSLASSNVRLAMPAIETGLTFHFLQQMSLGLIGGQAGDTLSRLAMLSFSLVQAASIGLSVPSDQILVPFLAVGLSLV